VKLVFKKSGEFHLACGHVPPNYQDESNFDVGVLPDGEFFDPRYSYTYADGIAVRGALLPVDAEEIARMEAEFEATQYQRDRAKAYPSFAEQFDLLYHGGYDAWKASIEAVKTQFPKPEGN
jgi:hypothetical protein